MESNFYRALRQELECIAGDELRSVLESWPFVEEDPASRPLRWNPAAQWSATQRSVLATYLRARMSEHDVLSMDNLADIYGQTRARMIHGQAERLLANLDSMAADEMQTVHPGMTPRNDADAAILAAAQSDAEQTYHVGARVRLVDDPTRRMGTVERVYGRDYAAMTDQDVLIAWDDETTTAERADDLTFGTLPTEPESIQDEIVANAEREPNVYRSLSGHVRWIPPVYVPELSKPVVTCACTIASDLLAQNDYGNDWVVLYRHVRLAMGRSIYVDIEHANADDESISAGIVQAINAA